MYRENALYVIFMEIIVFYQYIMKLYRNIPKWKMAGQNRFAVPPCHLTG